MKTNKFFKFAVMILFCLTFGLGTTLLIDSFKTKNSFIEHSDAAIHQKTYRAAVYFSPDGGDTFYKSRFDQNGYNGSLGTIESSIWYTDSNWSGATHWYCGNTGITSGSETAEVWGKRDGGALGGPYTTYFSFSFEFTPPEGFSRNANALISVDDLPDSKTYTGATINTGTWTTRGSSSVSIWTGTKQYDTFYYAVHLRPISYKIIYHNSYNSSNFASKSVRYYNKYVLPSEPTRAGYTFLGWYTGENGTGDRITSDSVKTSTGNQTLYSHWSRNEYRIDVNIMSPSGVQDYQSGSMTYYNSYSGNTYYNYNDQPENILVYGGQIKISNILPMVGMNLANVVSTKGNGSITNSGGTYTYTLNYGGPPSGSWDDEINIYMEWTNYLLTFNVNGGTSVSPVNKNYIYTDTFTLPSTSRYGYDFNGWKTSSTIGNWNSGTNYTANTTMSKMYGSVTLNAHWTPKTYNVVYHSNDGTGRSTSEGAKFDASVKLKPPDTFKRAGYTFKSWANATSKDNVSSGNVYTEYNADSSYIMITKEDGVNLYAIWTPNSYIITFNVNGGLYLSNMSYTPESTSTLPTPRRIGYGFTNWSVEKVDVKNNWNDSTYLSETSVKNKYGDVTLRANWSPQSWDLTFNPNGGSVTPTSKKVTIDTAYGELPTPTRPGYIFNGWYTAKSGGSLVTSSTYMRTEGAEIYAQWLETWASNITEDNKYKGSGTINDPYVISTAEQLAYLAREVQKGTTFAEGERKYFVQTAPINLSGKIWLPIGGSEIESGTTSFGGIYNGRGFAIIGLETQGEKFNNVGLFGRTSGAKLINVYVLNADVKGKNNVGILVGENASKPLEISCCFAKGVVNGTSSVGGIVGNDKVTGLKINNSGFAGSVTGGSIMVGSMAGGVIRDCYAEVNSNISFCGSSSGVTLDACVFETSEGKFYYSDKTPNNGITFDGWTTYQGKPLPSGITWIGGVSSTGATLDGYTKVDEIKKFLVFSTLIKKRT